MFILIKQQICIIPTNTFDNKLENSGLFREQIYTFGDWNNIINAYLTQIINVYIK